MLFLSILAIFSEVFFVNKSIMTTIGFLLFNLGNDSIILILIPYHGSQDTFNE